MLEGHRVNETTAVTQKSLVLIRNYAIDHLCNYIRMPTVPLIIQQLFCNVLRKATPGVAGFPSDHLLAIL